jgi:hypothetical protein
MPFSPDLELQGAIIAWLKADPDVAALVGNRIYDTVPENPVYPYIVYAGSDEFADDAECIRTSVITVQIDVWSRAVGYPEAKIIVDAIRNSLHDATLTLSINALVTIEVTRLRVLRDPDGLTNHGIAEITSTVERAAA